MLQNKFNFSLSIVLIVCLWSQRVISRSEAAEPIAQSAARNNKPAVMNPDLLVQNNNLKITNIRLNNTDNGLRLIVENDSKRQLIPLILTEGNNLVIELTDAELDLATGNNFRETNPAPGITGISARQIDDNNIRITITGKDRVPAAEVTPSQENLVLSVTPEASITLTEADEEIEVIATGEGEDESYFVPDVTSATRINTSRLNTPQSIQVVPKKY